MPFTGAVEMWRALAILGLALVDLGIVMAADAATPLQALGVRLSVELTVVLGLILVVAPRPRRWIAAIAGPLIALTLLVGLTDLGLRQIMGRPLDLSLDVDLLGAVWNLLRGTLGLAGALLVAVLLACLPPLLAWAVARLLRGATADLPPFGRPAMLAGLAFLVLLAGTTSTLDARASQRLFEQYARWRDDQAALAGFAERARDDLLAPLSAPLPRALAGIDVLLVFVESYGRSAVEQSPEVVLQLTVCESVLQRAGLGAVTGYLTSPTVGGQSWLAHETLLSGLWIDNQRSYDLLLHSQRRTLFDAFERTGHRRVMVMPAITMPWPEAGFFPVDGRYFAPGLGYAGPSYGWVTMPDQYTLSAFEARERPAGPRKPVFAEIVLISSHAPWTPVPELVDDWSAIGDGRIFASHFGRGASPEVVWSSKERIKAAYVSTVDYSLAALCAYAAGHVDDKTLLIFLGDHQPAAIVTGPGASRDVPMHVVARRPDLLVPFLSWGFTPAMLPPRDAPAHRMDAFRDWLVHAYAKPG